MRPFRLLHPGESDKIVWSQNEVFFLWPATQQLAHLIRRPINPLDLIGIYVHLARGDNSWHQHVINWDQDNCVWYISMAFDPISLVAMSKCKYNFKMQQLVVCFVFKTIKWLIRGVKLDIWLWIYTALVIDCIFTIISSFIWIIVYILWR